VKSGWADLVFQAECSIRKRILPGDVLFCDRRVPDHLNHSGAEALAQKRAGRESGHFFKEPRQTYSKANGRVCALTPWSQCTAFFVKTNW